MKKVLKGLTTAENFIMAVTFALMVICSFAQVVNRNIFKLPIVWFDEASTYCMIYMALIGTEIGLRDGSQIAVTAVTDKLHGSCKGIVSLCAKIVVLIFSSTILITVQARIGQTSAALHLPMTVPYAALVISFAMIVLVQLGMAIEIVIKIAKGDSFEDEEVEA